MTAWPSTTRTLSSSLLTTITDNDETVSKTKELIVDYRKRRAVHGPIHIDGAVVEQVESFEFLDVQITEHLKNGPNT